MSEHSRHFLRALNEALEGADENIDLLSRELEALRTRGGRLFVLGVGGGAANAAHAVNDFRKLCGIEAYAPTDSVAELTARANDEGWETIFTGWLRGSWLCERDALLIFSVGGGHPNVSACIHEAVLLAKERGARVFGVVGKPDGAVAQHGDVVVLLPDGPLVTPITEAAQIIVLHALVSDPRLQVVQTKW